MFVVRCFVGLFLIPADRRPEGRLFHGAAYAFPVDKNRQTEDREPRAENERLTIRD